jgi:hypothetical protein
MKIKMARLQAIADDLEEIASKYDAHGIEMDLAQSILIYRAAHRNGHECEQAKVAQKIMDHIFSGLGEATEIEIEDEFDCHHKKAN